MLLFYYNKTTGEVANYLPFFSIGKIIPNSPNVNSNIREGFKCDSVVNVNKHISSNIASTINT